MPLRRSSDHPTQMGWTEDLPPELHRTRRRRGTRHSETQKPPTLSSLKPTGDTGTEHIQQPYPGAGGTLLPTRSSVKRTVSSACSEKAVLGFLVPSLDALRLLKGGFGNLKRLSASVIVGEA